MFRDRVEAGQKLAVLVAEQIKEVAGVVVYALPRGGVVTGFEVAKGLGVPLDILTPRKIGHPYSPEYAICAVTEHGEPICNEYEVASVDEEWLQQAIEEQREESKRRSNEYGKQVENVPENVKTGIIVDDGIATGLTMKAAISELKSRGVERIIVAVPVTPRDTYDDLAVEVDQVIALINDESFKGAIGAYYYNFDQTEDREVTGLLEEAQEL